jgi:hypothetical protein
LRRYIKAIPTTNWLDSVAAKEGQHTAGKVGSGFAESANGRLREARFKAPLPLIDHVLAETVMAGPDGYCPPRHPPHFH